MRPYVRPSARPFVVLSIRLSVRPSIRPSGTRSSQKATKRSTFEEWWESRNPVCHKTFLITCLSFVYHKTFLWSWTILWDAETFFGPPNTRNGQEWLKIDKKHAKNYRRLWVFPHLENIFTISTLHGFNYFFHIQKFAICTTSKTRSIACPINIEILDVLSNTLISRYCASANNVLSRFNILIGHELWFCFFYLI